MASRGKKIYSFRIDETTKSRIDQLVLRNNISRSALLSRAVCRYLEENANAY